MFKTKVIWYLYQSATVMWSNGFILLNFLNNVFIHSMYRNNNNVLATAVVLQNPSSVSANTQVTFNCSVSGNGVDPASVTWKITEANSQTETSVNFTTQLFGTANPSDGSVLSMTTFVLTSDIANKRLWCVVTDQGSTTPSYQIFTYITITNQGN